MNNIKNKLWWDKASVRAIKTIAQTFIAIVGTGAVGITDLDWLQIASLCAMSGILSLATSIAGIPEVETKEGE